eukprot:3933226-Rhodomonas_salina.1
MAGEPHLLLKHAESMYAACASSRMIWAGPKRGGQNASQEWKKDRSCTFPPLILVETSVSMTGIRSLAVRCCCSSLGFCIAAIAMVELERCCCSIC